MPTYEYRCENCGKFEHVQRITDEPLARCPKCNGQVRRLISRAGIVFKGSGFHVTDYGKERKTAKPAAKEIKNSSTGPSPKK